MDKRKLEELDIDQKETIYNLQNRKRCQKLSEEFIIPKSAVSNIKNNENAIKQAWEENYNTKQKRICKELEDDVTPCEINMETKQLTVSWEGHQKTFVSMFETLFRHDILVDCTLAADGQYLKAHKVVLAACSPYFQLLFNQENDKHPIVILKDVKFQELKAILDFVYKGEVQILENNLETFLEVANSLKIKGLKYKSDQNKTNMNKNTYLEIVPESCDNTLPICQLSSNNQRYKSQKNTSENKLNSFVTPIINETFSLCDTTICCNSPNSHMPSVSQSTLQESKAVDIQHIVATDCDVEVCAEFDTESMNSVENGREECEQCFTQDNLSVQNVTGMNEHKGKSYITTCNKETLKENTNDLGNEEEILPIVSVIVPDVQEECFDETNVKVKLEVEDECSNQKDVETPQKHSDVQNISKNCETVTCTMLETLNTNGSCSANIQTSIQSQMYFSGTTVSSSNVHTEDYTTHITNSQEGDCVTTTIQLKQLSCVPSNTNTSVKQEPLNDIQIESFSNTVPDQELNACDSPDDGTIHLRKSSNFSEPPMEEKADFYKFLEELGEQKCADDVCHKDRFQCGFDHFSEEEEDIEEEKPYIEQIEIDETYPNSLISIHEECSDAGVVTVVSNSDRTLLPLDNERLSTRKVSSFHANKKHETSIPSKYNNSNSDALNTVPATVHIDSLIAGKNPDAAVKKILSTTSHHSATKASCDQDINNSKWISHLQEVHVKDRTFEYKLLNRIRAPSSCKSKIFQNSSLPTNENLHTCPLCDETFAILDTLQKHLQVHEQNSFKCRECGQLFLREYNLIKHSRIHINCPCKCLECGKTFKSNKLLKKHQKEIHFRNSHFQCNECGIVFKSAHLLVVHEVLHVKNRLRKLS